MKRITVIVFVTIALLSTAFPQTKDKNREGPLRKINRSVDRAAGTHNASNIGLFFENRGKLYPRSLTQGPSGEYPINSGHHYIYRMNPMVAFPNNVIQGRFATDEEWEAAFGYHNIDSAQIAFSDKPYTWHPTTGWPVKDATGKPVFKSDQDSYCVFNDSGNTRKVLGIQVHQTGYTYGVTFAKNMIYFRYDVINKSNNSYDSMYFNMYFDGDIGDASGGALEYQDDRYGFDSTRNMVYMYDTKGYSLDWNTKSGYMGVAFMQTPKVNGKELGLTDCHYLIYDYDLDIDSLQYGVISSSQSLFNSTLGTKYFHTASANNIHYDDPAKLPASGADLLFNASSGPYTINPNDTLTFYVALLAGDNLAGLNYSHEQAKSTLAKNFELPKPPNRPALAGVPGNKKSVLYWNNAAELSMDSFSGETDFEGYRIYKSKDRGITWEQIKEFDKVNSIGSNSGIQYSMTDSNVVNGMEYWYSITAFDRGSDLISSLESPIGNNLQALNTVSIIPRSDAIGREPVSAATVQHFGTGNSNYNLIVDPVDNESLSGNVYDTEFSYLVLKEVGNLKTAVTIQYTDTLLTQPYRYGIQFKSASTVDIVNLTTGALIGRAGLGYPTGGRTFTLPSEGFNVKLVDEPGTATDLRPEAGDMITINFSVKVVRNNTDTVIALRPIDMGQKQAIDDGVLFSLNAPEVIQNKSRVGGTENIELEFSVDSVSRVVNETYLLATSNYGYDSSGAGFIGIVIRRAAGDTVTVIDTLYDQATFSFKGIRVKVVFDPKKPPKLTNLFSIETVKPVMPSIRDKYKFTIKGSTVNTAKQSSEMHKIRVVPNPYIVSSLFESELGELRLEPLRQIQFINLPSNCTIYIFTVAGDLVKTLYHDATGGTEVWDLRTESGREIAPGLYMYVVKTDQKQYIERFAIIK
ncbi:MAG: hypothetical protein HYV28_11760 [Ignavibacteriales bacterium]|nr:hypothetical protein [Ignavibacteriales bacterium]